MQNVKTTAEGKKGPASARLFMLFARESSISVIFRRGPSGWVQLIRWNTAKDIFEPGQWFHGRIYERRADLSPDGTLLIYFARKGGRYAPKNIEYTHAWTAISKPPYFTALALWPKGDCWHGGGLFKSNRIVMLNHKPDAAKPHPHHVPRGICVELIEDVQGEDDPIFSVRLERDGWKLTQKWEVENLGFPKLFVTRQPEIREKASPGGSLIQISRSIATLDYSEEFAVSSEPQARPTLLEHACWADWDQQGRLVFAREGKILAGRFGDDGCMMEHELIDLNPSKPSAVPPPNWAMKW